LTSVQKVTVRIASNCAGAQRSVIDFAAFAVRFSWAYRWLPFDSWGAAAMQGWHTPCLGLRELPREFSPFELQAFFTFSLAERELIERRRGDHRKLGLALHIGFVRMSGRPLNSVRAVPVALLRHLGQTLDIATPDLASLRALYSRGRTLFDHQQQACEVRMTPMVFAMLRFRSPGSISQRP